MRPEGLGDPLGGHGVPVGRFELDHAEPIGLADGQPPLGKRAGIDHDHPVAGREGVGHRRFHGAGAGAGRGDHILLSLHKTLQSLAHLEKERVVFSGPVMDDGPGHGEQDIGRDGRGARRHELILLHVLLLPRVVCAVPH